MTQAQLDALVCERLAWVARFASSVSHDLGNVVLFSPTPQPIDSEMPEALRRCRQSQADLIAQFRQLLAGMSVWRDSEGVKPIALSPKAWWTAYGSMIRQFVSPDARVALASAGDDCLLDSKRLARIMSGMLVAIDAQVDGLARVTVRIGRDSRSGDIALTIAVSPRTKMQALILPTSVKRLLKFPDRDCEYGESEGVEHIVMALDAAE
jgi:hypothetical protein